MIPDIKISIADLLRYCKIYDGVYGNYPESEWEGKDVFEEVIQLMHDEKLITRDQLETILNYENINYDN